MEVDNEGLGSFMMGLTDF
jgi:hypothetical protein